MKIDFTGRQTEIPVELRKLAERKLAKIEKLLPSVTRAHVIVTADKHRLVAEVSVHSRQLDLAAAQVAGHARLSITGAIDKLLRQAEKQCARRKPRKGSESPRLAQTLVAEPAAPPIEAGQPRVIRSRRTLLKPMTLDEAALEMDGRGDGVVVFRDAATARVSVLFRRKDGNLGLIEPEA